MWKTWLSRSGTCPLRINVRFASYKTSHLPYLPIIDMLVSCSHRWLVVNLDMPFSLDAFSAIKGSLPILKALDLRHPGTAASSLLDMFEVAPNLRTVNISPRGYRLPWVQLTHFVTPCLSIDGCLTTLERCPNLITCHLACESGHPVDAIRLIRPKLQSLRIDVVNGTSSGCILDSLTCRALTRLHVRHRPLAIPTWLQDHLPSFLTRSSCVLRTLVLHNISLDTPSLIPSLELLPSLIEFNILESNDSIFPIPCGTSFIA